MITWNLHRLMRRVMVTVVVTVLATAAVAGCSTNGPSDTSVMQSPDTSSPTPHLDDFASPDDVAVDTTIEFGRSVEGRAITVLRHGDRRGVRVVIVGCIHGDESAGMAVVDRLRRAGNLSGVDLWLVPTINPDGTSAGTRVNAHRVDLNRNFPPTWQPLGAPGDWEYGGPTAASEPETRAMVTLGSFVRPELVLWYHQDLNRISPGPGRQGEIRARYAELTGLPLIGVSGGTYTGTANRWGKSTVSARGASFTVELGPALSDEQARRHAEAVVTVAREFFRP